MITWTEAETGTMATVFGEGKYHFTSETGTNFTSLLLPGLALPSGEGPRPLLPDHSTHPYRPDHFTIPLKPVSRALVTPTPHVILSEAQRAEELVLSLSKNPEELDAPPPSRSLQPHRSGGCLEHQSHPPNPMSS